MLASPLSLLNELRGDIDGSKEVSQSCLLSDSGDSDRIELGGGSNNSGVDARVRLRLSADS